MMSALREKHPGLEIESCCGGGGRIDLGVLEHADRVWVSDCIDAHERHRMVRWTGLTLPPELMGTHIGSGADHVTGRQHTLGFRAGTAMWGHLGIECDLASFAGEEREELRAWIDLHKRFRGLLHSGRVVHADLTNEAIRLEGVVARDGGEALYRLSALDHSLTMPAGRVPLPGLNPETSYRVRPVSPGRPSSGGPVPEWYDGATVLTGRLLDEVGLMSPILQADDLVILHAEAVTR